MWNDGFHNVGLSLLYSKFANLLKQHILPIVCYILVKIKYRPIKTILQYHIGHKTTMASASNNEGMNMSIFDIMGKIAVPGECTHFLHSNNLLLKDRICDRCLGQMSLHKTTAVTDGQRWNCTSCKNTRSIRDSSIFHVSVFWQYWQSFQYMNGKFKDI